MVCAQAATERRWKLLAGDVFRPPPSARLLAAHFGAGAQLLATAAAVLLFGAAGVFSPERPVALRRAGASLFFCFAPIGGFAAVALLRSVQRSAAGWLTVCVKTACYFPGVICAATAVVTRSMAAAGAAAPDPAVAPAPLLSAALAVGLPLTVVGGSLACFAPTPTWPLAPTAAANKAPPADPPPRSRARRVATLLTCWAAACITPFSVVYIEHSVAMDSLWRRLIYTPFGFMAAAAALAVVTAAGVSVMCTHQQLCGGDSSWWWPAFHRGGGAAAVAVAVHAAFYHADHLPGLRGSGLLLYTAYMASVALAVYLCVGTASLAASLVFVHAAYSRLARAELAQHADVERHAARTPPAPKAWAPAW